MALSESVNRHAGSSTKKEDVHILGKRDAIAYRIPETKYEFDEEPDDFYDLTVEDVKMLYRQLKKARQELEEEPLLTKKKREELQQKERLHHNVVIRVQFPDMTVLQGVFRPEERISDVLDFVNEHVRLKTDSAYLYTAPPKVILEPSHTLQEANCVPTSKVYYGKKTVHPLFTAFLEEDILRHLSTHEAACHLAASCRSTFPSLESIEGVEPEDWGESYDHLDEASTSTPTKLPAWIRPFVWVHLVMPYHIPPVMETKSFTVACKGKGRLSLSFLPSDTMHRVLSAACSKFHLNPEKYELRYGNQKLSPMTNVVLSELPQEAELDLLPGDTAEDTDNTMMVDMVIGNDIIASGLFQSTESLWNVAENLLSKDKYLEDDRTIFSVFGYEMIGRNYLEKTPISSLSKHNERLVISCLGRKYSEECLLDKESTSAHSNHSQEQPKLTEPPIKLYENKEDYEKDIRQLKLEKSYDSIKLVVKRRKDSKINDKKVRRININKHFKVKKKLKQQKADELLQLDERLKAIDNKRFQNLQLEDEKQQTIEKSKLPEIPGPTETENKKEVLKVKKKVKTIEAKVTEVKAREEKEVSSNTIIETSIHYEKIPLKKVKNISKAQVDKGFYRNETERFKDVNYLEERRGIIYTLKTPKPGEMLGVDWLGLREKSASSLDLSDRYMQIKVIFPDKSVIQAVFGKSETVQDVMTFIKPYMSTPTVNFYLYTMNPKLIMEGNRSLRTLRSTPEGSLYLGLGPLGIRKWARSKPFIKHDLLPAISKTGPREGIRPYEGSRS